MPGLEQELKSKFVNERVKADLNVLFTANFLSNKMNARLKPFDLTHEQYNVLRILRGKHPQCMCQKDILARMIARSSNITLIVKRLVKKKWINVEQSAKDRREYEISVTDAGLKKLTELDNYLTANDNNFSKLTESEAFHLNALLDKIRS